jgi:hypothetical protein
VNTFILNFMKFIGQNLKLFITISKHSFSVSVGSLLELRFVIEKDRDVIGAHKGDTNVTAVFSINVVTSCKSITRKKS